MPEIPVSAVERNQAWIEAVTTTLRDHGDPQLSRLAMKNAGSRCADQLRAKIVAHYGREPRSVDEFIQAVNKRRRELLGNTNMWVKEGNRVYFHLDRCGCDMVENGLAQPNPTYCLCSAGMFENLFAPFWPGSIRAEIVKAIGMGDDCCEFVIVFDE